MVIGQLCRIIWGHINISSEPPGLSIPIDLPKVVVKALIFLHHVNDVVDHPEIRCKGRRILVRVCICAHAAAACKHECQINDT